MAKRIPPFWDTDSTPFSARGEPTQPCRIVLQQVSDGEFDLVDPLVFTPPAGVPGVPGAPLDIDPDWLRSDLASIPDVVGWFARRHGRHTPAALVHDLLITEEGRTRPSGYPPEWELDPTLADLLFRRMLLASGVPPVRSAIMWAAVTFRTRLNTGAARRWAVIAWIAAALAGTVLLAVSLAQLWWLLAVVALLAPVPASALWGRQFAAGLIAGYAVWWALLGAAPAWIAFKLYQAVEGAVWLVRWWMHRRRGQPAVEAPATPPTYDQR